jgi:hypothetical protein
LAPRIDHGLRPLEYPRIGDKAHKRKQADPGQPDACGTIELLVKPVARRFMLRE